MAAKKTKPGYDFLVTTLKKNPKAVYGDVAAAAKKKGFTVYPIMWGRAKAALGLVKSKPRGKGKAATRKEAVRKGGRGAARTPVLDGTIASIVAAVKTSEQAKSRYRDALEKIRGILEGVL